jgi:hypothetical protein
VRSFDTLSTKQPFYYVSHPVLTLIRFGVCGSKTLVGQRMPDRLRLRPNVVVQFRTKRVLGCAPVNRRPHRSGAASGRAPRRYEFRI